jgi:predicted Zn finger-like uncharacterized protein
MSATAVFEVACPSCDTRFSVNPDRVPTPGIPAVCSECMRTFQVDLPEEILQGRNGAPSLDAEAPAAPAEPEAVPREDVRDELWHPPADTSDDLWRVTPEGTATAPSAPETEAPDFVPPEPVESPILRPPPGGPDAGAPVHEEIAPPPEPEPEPPAEDDASFHDLSTLASEVLAEEEESDEPDAGSAALSLGAARFGRRDPQERARRLARVLVSDIIAYSPERHDLAVSQGTVKETFAEEVEKSRREYVDQVGEEMAASTDYFREALNDLLARGQQIY